MILAVRADLVVGEHLRVGDWAVAETWHLHVRVNALCEGAHCRHVAGEISAATNIVIDDNPIGVNSSHHTFRAVEIDASEDYRLKDVGVGPVAVAYASRTTTTAAGQRNLRGLVVVVADSTCAHKQSLTGKSRTHTQRQIRCAVPWSMACTHCNHN